MGELTERAAVIEAVDTGDYGGEGERLAAELILAVQKETLERLFAEWPWVIDYIPDAEEAWAVVFADKETRGA